MSRRRAGAAAAARGACLGIDNLAHFLMRKAVDRIVMRQGQGTVCFLQQLFAQQLIQGFDGLHFLQPGDVAEMIKGGLLRQDGSRRQQLLRLRWYPRQPTLNNLLHPMQNPAVRPSFTKLRPINVPGSLPGPCPEPAAGAAVALG